MSKLTAGKGDEPKKPPVQSPARAATGAKTKAKPGKAKK